MDTLLSRPIHVSDRRHLHSPAQDQPLIRYQVRKKRALIGQPESTRRTPLSRLGHELSCSHCLLLLMLAYWACWTLQFCLLALRLLGSCERDPLMESLLFSCKSSRSLHWPAQPWCSRPTFLSKSTSLGVSLHGGTRPWLVQGRSSCLTFTRCSHVGRLTSSQPGSITRKRLIDCLICA
jgi:hypothetical protein